MVKYIIIGGCFYEKKKKDVYKVKPLTEGKKNIIASLLQEYDIQSAQDIQVALCDLLAGTIQSMLEAEMEEHPGYENYERTEDRSEGDNYRNETKKKKIRFPKNQKHFYFRSTLDIF